MSTAKRVEVRLDQQEYELLEKCARLGKRSVTAQASFCIAACCRAYMRTHERMLDEIGKDIVEELKP